MKFKNLIFLSVFAVLLPLNLTRVSAVNANPASGEIAPGATQNLTLIASPPAPDQVAVEIQLVSSNMTILSYTPPSGGNWSSPLALCDGGGSFTSTSVCVALAKESGTITAGESLGTISVQFGTTEGNATLTRTADNKYSDLGTETIQTGVAGIYTVQAGAPSQLPNTALFDFDNKSLWFGLVILVLGIFITIKVVFFVLPNKRFRLKVS